MNPRIGLVVASVFLAGTLPSFAAGDPPSSQAAQKPDTQKSDSCKQSASNQPATQPTKGNGDGTAPGNSGSTGWTGGMGGSQIGTNPNGQTENSKTYQPAVARGIDPIKGMPAQKC